MNRNSTLDRIRITALFTLIGYHFLYYMGFYEATCTGWQMLVMCIIRVLFSVNIPLFLLLTGYLMTNKKLEKAYYKKCTRTIWIYLLCCVSSTLYRFVVGGIVTSPYEFLKTVLNFTCCPYAWYVEMYLGLFLLIPFLNVLYHNLPSKCWKQVLVVTFIALTTLPSFFNVYRFEELQWWTQPQSNNDFFKIVPGWWMAVYPITYDFIGNYIREYGVKIKRSITGILIIAVSALMGCYSYWRSIPGAYNWGPWQDWNSWVNVLMGVLVFAFILGEERKQDVTNQQNASWTRYLATISKCVFGAYLLSWIAEEVVYHFLPKEQIAVPDRIIFYPVIIVVMGVSLLLSGAINIVYDMALKVIQKARQ